MPGDRRRNLIIIILLALILTGYLSFLVVNGGGIFSRAANSAIEQEKARIAQEVKDRLYHDPAYRRLPPEQRTRALEEETAAAIASREAAFSLWREVAFASDVLLVAIPVGTGIAFFWSRSRKTSP